MLFLRKQCCKNAYPICNLLTNSCINKLLHSDKHRSTIIMHNKVKLLAALVQPNSHIYLNILQVHLSETVQLINHTKNIMYKKMM